ncbi:MAG: LysR family transcriptional regulator [Puniceicoccales bacterium]|jgi:DNA-binding transcriptional LysR family regulator|nr:LysR family transcriptional regulator [Puniceicoccales bacterium]
MNITTLKVFLDLADNASFSKTALQNGVSQSAISQKIKLLEGHLNVNLLEKKQKSFQLTQEGVVAYRHMKRILCEYDSMLKNLKNYDPKVVNGIQLFTNQWIGTYIIPHYINEYFRIFKNFNLDIHYGNYDQMQTGKLDSKTDLTILEFPISNEDWIAESFMEDEFVIAYLGQTKFHNKRTFPLSELKSLLLIGFNKNHPLRSIFEQAVEKWDISPRYLMEFNQIELIKQAIETYSGIAVLPKSSVQPSSGQRLQIIPFENIHIRIPLYLIYNRKRKITQSLEHFIAILKGNPLLH